MLSRLHHSFPPAALSLVEWGSERLTEEDDDAEQDGDDGAGAQAGSHEVLLVGAVSVDVALADFDSQVGGVGHGQVARVRDDDGDLVDAAFEEANLQAQLGVVAWRRREGKPLVYLKQFTCEEKKKVKIKVTWPLIDQLILVILFLGKCSIQQKQTVNAKW